MKSLVGPGTVEAPPHHKIAFGGASVWPSFLGRVGFVGVIRQAFPHMVNNPFPSDLLRKQGLPLSIVGLWLLPQWALQHWGHSLPPHWGHLSTNGAVLPPSPALFVLQDTSLSFFFF